MAKVGTAYVEVKPDLRGFSKGLNREMKGINFGALTKGAAVAGLAIGAGLVVEAKKAVDAYTETEKVGKQTNAVLKSTGRVAQVSAKHVGDLATAISRKTGIDDEQIQSSENLLLTFTNVRNEAGKGNKVFDRATQAVTDMSVALGQDTKSSAIQLGKALNDPVKGITALQRVGVSFTAQQKGQIQTLVKSGKTLDAQKMILREINKEFGGSAAAQAQPLDKLKVAVGNIQEAIGSGLKPAVDEVAKSLEGFAIKALPDVQKVADAVSKTFARKDIDLGDKIKISASKVRKAAGPVVTQLENELRSADLGPKLQEAFEKGVPKLVDAAAASAPRAAGAFINAFKNAGPWGQLLTAAFLAQKMGAFNSAGGAASGLFVKALKKGLGGPLSRALRASGETAAANAAEGLANQIPTSINAREGRLRTTFREAGTKHGKLFGRAFGLAAVIGLAYAAPDIVKQFKELFSHVKVSLKFHGITPYIDVSLTQDTPEETAQKIADAQGHPRNPIGNLPPPVRKKPAPRRRTEHHETTATPVPRRPDQRFGSRSAPVTVQITTPAGGPPDPRALADQLGRELRRRGG